MQYRKPWPHIDVGYAGLTFMVAAYGHARRKGLLLVAITGAVCLAACLLSATLAAVLVLAVFVPASLMALWTIRYAGVVSDIVSRPRASRAPYVGTFPVQYQRQAKVMGRPRVHRAAGDAAPGCEHAHCVVIGDSCYIVRDDEIPAEISIGDSVELEDFPAVGLLKRVNHVELRTGIWCHTWHRAALVHDMKRVVSAP